MITIDSILNDDNVAEVLSKYDADNRKEIDDYLALNRDRLFKEMRDGLYTPSVVNMNVINTSKGKRRTVALFNIADKFVLKLLTNAIKDEYENIFHQSSVAFQDNKVIQDAVDLAKVYIESGNDIMVSIDLKDYFEHINLEVMMPLLMGHTCSKLNNL